MPNLSDIIKSFSEVVKTIEKVKDQEPEVHLYESPRENKVTITVQFTKDVDLDKEGNDLLVLVKNAVKDK